MRKLLYSLCIAGFLASCNNEAKNKEAQDADMAKVTAAVEAMKATKLEESAAACEAAIMAAAQVKVDSINALPKAAQATAKKAVAKKAPAKKVEPKKDPGAVNNRPGAVETKPLKTNDRPGAVDDKPKSVSDRPGAN
ncbi:MAG: hypothetical protein IPK03_09370 [Bacteroidetes bacterium]|nr:hypothetical protein [Bacteroidota bacterium]